MYHGRGTRVRRPPHNLLTAAVQSLSDNAQRNACSQLSEHVKETGEIYNPLCKDFIERKTNKYFLKKKSYIYIDFQKENTIFAIMTKINNSMPVIGSLPLNGRSYDIRLFDLHFNTPTGGIGFPHSSFAGGEQLLLMDTPFTFGAGLHRST